MPKSREKNIYIHYGSLLHCQIYNVMLHKQLMKSACSFVVMLLFFHYQLFKIKPLTPISHMPYLNNKVPPSKVCNSPGQSCPAPHKTQEERSLCVGEGLHHFPEPLNQGSCWFNAFVSCYRFQKVKWNIRASTNLKNKIDCLATKV